MYDQVLYEEQDFSHWEFEQYLVWIIDIRLDKFLSEMLLIIPNIMWCSINFQRMGVLLFSHAIDAIFKNWSALQLAVAHVRVRQLKQFWCLRFYFQQSGGPQSKEKAEWLVGATESWFYQNKDLQDWEVGDLLESFFCIFYQPQENGKRRVSALGKNQFSRSTIHCFLARNVKKSLARDISRILTNDCHLSQISAYFLFIRKKKRWKHLCIFCL